MAIPNLTNANSTPEILGANAPITFPTPAVTAPTPTVAPAATVPPVATTPVAPPIPSTQADAIFKDSLNKAVTGTQTFDSSILKSTATPSTVLSEQDNYFQTYLKQQKEYQDKILASLSPSPEEAALNKRLYEQRIQAMQNQETALNSGETSSFAGGEAQRVARNDAIKTLALEAQAQTLQTQREQTLKGLEMLMNSSDKTVTTLSKIEELKGTLTGIEKQAQDTFFNLQQTNPGVSYQYDPSLSASENLTKFRSLVSSQPETLTPSKVQGEINKLTTDFRNEPVVKIYNTVAGVLTSLNEAGISPTDDIQRIYSFAKIMDPESAVREGEYATIQDYAVAYVQKLGLKANRIFNNDGFLTDEARKFMLNTLNNKYKSVERSYQNIYKDYADRIEQAKTGTVGGSLTNYAQGYTPSANIGSTKQPGAVIKTKIGEIRTDW